jgi:nitrite reductase/ring-hydroxylating ferredoxin subunit
MTGPVAKAEAWVRVVPSSAVATGKQADALVAGTPVLTGRYSNGKVWAIGAKNSATGTEMFGGKVDEAAQTLTDPQWGTKYSLVNGDVVGKWCPSPPIIGSLIGALFPPQGVWVPEVRESNGYVEVKLDVDAKAEFEKKFWKGILDAQGKADGGYY